MKKNLNSCTGCSFAGFVGGYEPECNCSKKAAIMAENSEVTADMVDDLLPDTEELYYTHQDAKNCRIHRRIAAKKHNRKAPKSLTIVNAKCNRLPESASSDDIEVVTKKYSNAAKKAVYRYDTPISLEFPEIPEGTSFGHGIDALYTIIYKWKKNKDASCEMKLACDNAHSILEAAFSNDGQLVGLHCERCERDDDGKKRNDDDVDVLQVKIGFHTEVSKSNFIRRTTAA